MITARPEDPIQPNEQTLFNASAGSGKTFNLVYHFLYRVFYNYQLDKSAVPFRNLIAVTFTIKAAGEMRKRILNTLASFRHYGMTELPSTDQKIADMIADSFEMKPDEFRVASEHILSFMTHFYNMVSVGTIDKFTHGIVRSFAQDLNLNPDFDVEMDAKMVLEKSVRQLISQVGRKDTEALSKTLVNQVLESVSEGKSWTVDRLLNDEAKSLISDVDREFAAVLSEIPDEKWDFFLKDLNKYVKDFEERAVELGRKMQSVIRSVNLDPSDFGYKIPEKIIEILTERDLEKIRKATIGTQFKKFRAGAFFNQTKTPTHLPLLEPVQEEFESLLDQYVEFVEESQFIHFVLNAKKSLNGLRFLGHVEKELESIREEENTVLISDFNRLIQENLRNQPEAFIYERSGERYQHYFIDEFQDTSTLPWDNLLPLIENALSTNGTNMLVGDAKQSIYRFRGAEVSQFIELASGNAAVTESPSGGISERYQRSTRQLPVNYRSYQNIVSFNNHMVEQIANQFHSKELSDPAIEAVYRNGVQEPHHRETGFVSAERLKYEEDKTLGETCNDYVFEKVRDALERGYRCRDIAVLLRNNRESSEIALFLSQQDGIVVISEDSLNTGNSSEVKLILASMRLQRSPDEPVFQTQWIQWLFDTGRMSEPECDQAYRAIRERRFIDWTKENPEWSMEESWIALPPSEWVDLLLDYFQIEPDPYVSKFMDEAFQYQRKAHEIQQHFVDYALENLSKWNIETPKTIDAITVSTIHKSKGLEYPIVIVPLVGWDMSGKRDRVWVKTEGVAPFGELPFVKAKPSDIKSIQLFEEPYAIWKKKHVMDHSNLMYVAFTRAEKELYIGIVPKDYKASYSNSASAYFGDMIERFSSFQQLEDENSFFAGEKTRVEKSSHSGSEKNGSALSQNPVTHWRDRIRIAPKREKSWDEERSDRDMGIAIHRILAETDSRDNALKMALEMHQNGEISSSDYNRLEQRLQFIWDNENIAEIFDHDLQILNEKAILTPDGKNYRPDRIIVDKNNVRVIDFKTGQERKSHQKQILKYGQLLEEMGFSNVSPELFYLGENEIHIVKLNLP